MIQHLQNDHGKLFLTVFSLLLLVIVTYSGSYLEKSFAASYTHIVAVGDWGCSENTEKIVEDVKSMSPQSLLALGDYSYDKTATCWFDIIKPVQSITKINIGNHETEGESMLNSYLNHFGLSKQFYSFDINNVHVLTMATEEEPEPNSDQYNFVVNDLRKAANNPDIKWIIVSLHRPIYTSPSASEASTSFRDPYHPLFDQYGVDLVLQGHNHNYQRSFPLNYNPSEPSDPIVTSTNASDYKNPNGAIFAIVGTGGVNLHGLSGSASFMAYQQDTKFGLLNMHFSDNKLDAKFVTNDRATMDHFSISKTAKKKIIERISDNMVADTKAKPLSEEEPKAEDKPPMTYKLKDDAATDTKAKPLSDKEDTKAKPLSEEVQKDKPTITYKLKDDAATDTKAKPLSEEEPKAEDKPPITYKLKDDASDKEDTKAKPLSEKEEDDKPAVTAKLSDDIATDDKPETQHNEEKADLSDERKSTDDKSHVGGLPGPSDNTGLVDDETTDSDKQTINTNDRDPFAALN